MLGHRKPRSVVVVASPGFSNVKKEALDLIELILELAGKIVTDGKRTLRDNFCFLLPHSLYF